MVSSLLSFAAMKCSKSRGVRASGFPLRLPVFIALALLALSSAAAARTESVDSLLARSHEAERSGKKSLAERLAQAAIVADPARAASYVALADLYRRDGHADFAAFYYAEALQLDPSNPEAKEGLAATEQADAAATATADQSLDKKKDEH